MKKYGYVPDLGDIRDEVSAVSVETLPSKIDLRPKMPPVYDQGQLGSCTANAFAGHVEYDLMAEGKGEWTPSRLFIYYNERKIEGTVDSDSGACLRDGIKTLNIQGVCPETVWPYNISKFKDTPPLVAYTSALHYKAVKYQRVPQTLQAIKSHLALNIPVVVGISVYSSFESEEVAKTGVVPMPQKSESLLGGHAVLIVGYDDSKNQFIMRNSWGDSWGDKGYFHIPYQYLTNPALAQDMWAINLVKA